MKQDTRNPIRIQSFVRAPVESVDAALQRSDGALSSSAAMELDLAQDLQMPIEASVRVPVHVDLVRIGEGLFNIAIRAKAHPNDYPRFRGQLSLFAAGDGCTLELRGRYVPPHGWLGDFVDSTFMRDTARASIQRFLEFIANDIVPVDIAKTH